MQGTMLIDYYSAVFCTPTPRQGGAVLTIVLIPTGLLRPSRDAAVRLIVVCFPVYPYFVQYVKELVCGQPGVEPVRRWEWDGMDLRQTCLPCGVLYLISYLVEPPVVCGDA